jgi:hypothetical protein
VGSGLLGHNAVSLVSGCRASKDHSVFILNFEDKDNVIPQQAGSNSPNNITSLKTCIFKWSLNWPWTKWKDEKKKHTKTNEKYSTHIRKLLAVRLKRMVKIVIKKC